MLKDKGNFIYDFFIYTFKVLHQKYLIIVACEVDAAKLDGSTDDQDATQFSARIELPGFRLRFKDGASAFKIAIFADLHYGENAWDDWGPRQEFHECSILPAESRKPR